MEKYNTQNTNGILINPKGVILCIVLMLCLLSANASRDHLRPVPPLCFGGYEKAVLSSLISEKDPHLWMVVLPQRDSQYAVILSKRIELDENYEVKEQQWILKSVRLKKRIPVKTFNAEEIRELVHSTEQEQHFLAITNDFEKKIKAAWLSVLKQTRYPDEPLLFGETFVFFCQREGFGGHYGIISSPKIGSPAMLVELAQKLIDLTQAEEKDREAIQKQCLEIASKITQEKRVPNSSF